MLPPWKSVIGILVSEVHSEERCYFSISANFWTWDIIWNVLAILYHDNFFTECFTVEKVARMMNT